MAERSTKTKSARLELRVSRATKDLCQRAAKLQGRSLTDFVLHSAIAEANRTVRDSELLELSRKDRLALMEALLHPQGPNRNLKLAAADWAKLVAN